MSNGTRRGNGHHSALPPRPSPAVRRPLTRSSGYDTDEWSSRSRSRRMPGGDREQRRRRVVNPASVSKYRFRSAGIDRFVPNLRDDVPHQVRRGGCGDDDEPAEGPPGAAARHHGPARAGRLAAGAPGRGRGRLLRRGRRQERDAHRREVLRAARRVADDAAADPDRPAAVPGPPPRHGPAHPLAPLGRLHPVLDGADARLDRRARLRPARQRAACSRRSSDWPGSSRPCSA